MNDYDISVLHHLRKSNVVADTLNKMYMCSVARGDVGTKELKTDVHRMTRVGVRFEDSPKEGFMVHHNTDSSLVV